MGLTDEDLSAIESSIQRSLSDWNTHRQMMSEIGSILSEDPHETARVISAASPVPKELRSDLKAFIMHNLRKDLLSV